MKYADSVLDNLVGPFAARASSTDGYEIADSNGIVAIWAWGESVANELTAFLNALGFCAGGKDGAENS